MRVERVRLGECWVAMRMTMNLVVLSGGGDDRMGVGGLEGRWARFVNGHHGEEEGGVNGFRTKRVQCDCV